LTGNFVASNLKEMNRRSVYTLLRAEEEISKAEIARASGISAPTVIKIIDYFKSTGFVVEAGEGSSALGRKPQLLRYEPTAAYSVGAEFDGYHLLLGLVDLSGRVGPLLRRRVAPDARTFLTSELAPAVRDLIAEAGIAPGRVTGLGLGLPGVVGPSPRTLSFAPFVGVDAPLDLSPFLDKLEAELGLPIAVENDANAAALGEYAARGLGEEGDLLYIELGRGLGAGLIMDGRLRKGPRAFAGELGYIVLDPAHSTSTGRPGWLETRMDLSDLWTEVSRDGEPTEQSLCRTAALLALALTNICVAVDVDLVVVGSAGLTSFVPKLVTALKAELARLSALEVRCEAPLAREPGVAGAAALAAGRWLDGIFAG
jgi:predicted NBD/HSP70 family sugar kinase